MHATVMPAVPSNVKVPTTTRTPKDLADLLERFTELTLTQQHRKLDGDEARTLADLTKEILDAGSVAEAELRQLGRRSPRTAMRLKVKFTSSKEAAQAFTRDIGTGGVAIETEVPMHPGMTVSLQLAVPGAGKPIRVQGEVVWAKEGAAGISFKEISEGDSQRLEGVVAQSASFLDRLRSKIAPARPISGDHLSVAPSILVQTSDRVLFETSVAVLGLRGYHATDGLPASVTPVLIAADGQHVANATASYPGVPFIVLNSSGMESLVGKLSKLTPLGFVRRPATGIGVADAVEAAMQEQAIRRAS